MPVSKNHNKKECHSKKRKRYAKHKFDEQRKWTAFQAAEEMSRRILEQTRMSSLRNKLFGNKTEKEK
tara:strand:+ start:2113 stop:2313 length:201 start_codon:yes stop_codon:yes gene_type:complete